MSRRVIGYKDGVTLYRDERPSAAHITGWGGSALGAFSGTTLTVKQKRDNAPRKHLRRAPRERCNIPTRFGDPCGRTPRHMGPHKSPEAVARIAASRRSS